MRIYLKSGKSFRISQAFAEEIIKSMESDDRGGDFITIKESFNNGLSKKFVFGVNLTEIAAIK